MSADIGHQWGADLEVGPTGDLAVVGGSTITTQRILRRMLTNPGSYIWNLTYGAGLPAFVGGTTAIDRIQAIARAQMLQESAISPRPEPSVTVVNRSDTEMGTFELNIQYWGTASGQPIAITVPVTG